MRRILRSLLLGLSACAVSPMAWATDFYVDPQIGSMQNDGSSAKPWKTLEEVFAQNKVESQGWESLPYDSSKKLVAKNPGAPVKAGDTIWLRSGYHGAVEIVGYYNATPITIAAASGETPKLARVLIQAGKNWKLSSLQISPEFAPTYDPQRMVTIENHDWQGPVSDVTVENCLLQSKADVKAWTASDWDQLSADGIGAGGKNITIRGNSLKNVNFGISVDATDSLIEKNVVDSFAGDGMRGLGDYTTFQYNVVKNCYAVNANHDDGFQSWSVGAGGVGTGEVKGIVLRGNTIINYEDPNQPFRGTLQGIGCFDGMFVDWVIENNVIITDHWHGITLLGAKNSRIVNNTVLDENDVDPGPPWIMIDAHKDGTPPEGCLVRNNLTTALSLADTGVTEDHNLIIDSLDKFFVNAAGFDVHLLQNSPAVNAGSPDQAPAIDIEGIPRPQGAGFDIGAYEWHDPSVVPPDGGPGGSAGSGGSSTGGSTSGGASSGGASSGGSGGKSGSGAKAADSGDDSGCGCRTTKQSHSPAWLVLLALGLAEGMRRRGRQRLSTCGEAV